MNEDNKKEKYREIKYFLPIIFAHITLNILYIKLLIIDKSITRYVYVDLISLFLFSFSLLHIAYRDFFLQYKVKSKSKTLLLLAEVALMLPATIRYIPNDHSSWLPFIIIVVIDILIILLTWSILVWFEKRRDNKNSC